MTKTYSYNPLEKIQYMQLPDGLADVWLHENIEQTKDEDGNTVWTADEVYFRTAKTEEEIEANFDEIFMNGGTGETFDPDPDPDEGDPDNPTTLSISERLDELEANMKLLLEVAVNSGDISTDDITGAIRDAVKADIEGGLKKDFP